jgi:hypothetical protein
MPKIKNEGEKWLRLRGPNARIYSVVSQSPLRGPLHGVGRRQNVHRVGLMYYTEALLPWTVALTTASCVCI